MKLANPAAPTRRARTAPRFISIGQASRISGITPGYLAALAVTRRINGYEMPGKTRVRERYIIERPSLVDYLATADRNNPNHAGGRYATAESRRRASLPGNVIPVSREAFRNAPGGNPRHPSQALANAA